MYFHTSDNVQYNNYRTHSHNFNGLQNCTCFTDEGGCIVRVSGNLI